MLQTLLSIQVPSFWIQGLQENTTGTIIWESFEYPSDTFLPKMKLSANVRTGKKVQITSWKSPLIHPLEYSLVVLNLLVFHKYSFGKTVARIGAVVHGMVGSSLEYRICILDSLRDSVL